MTFPGTKKVFLMLALGLSLASNSGLAEQPDYSNISNPFLGHAYMIYLQGDPLRAMAVDLVAEKQKRLGEDSQLSQLFLASNFAKLDLYEEAIKVYAGLVNQTNNSLDIRDTAWLEMAKLQLETGQSAAALAALTNIKLKLNGQEEADFNSAKARALLETGKVNEAVAALPKISDESIWALYQSFNIGVKLIDQYRNKNGALILHQISRLDNKDNGEIQAIQDQANLALGFSLLKINKPKQARAYLENVRLKSHLSNVALLGMGWSYSLEENYEQALVFWLELQNRPYRSTYGYETMLAVPYALGKAKAFNQALQHYQAAQQQISADIEDMNKAKEKINSNLFLTLISAAPDKETDWLANWINSPEAPESRFLPLLLDNPEFQATLMEYRALLQLKNHILGLEKDINQLEEVFRTTSSDSEIANLHLRYQTVSQQTDKAMAHQLGLLRQQALTTLSRYQAQLNNYLEQIKFGIAQAIEGGTFKAEEGLQ